jgi:hypothetical protein
VVLDDASLAPCSTATLGARGCGRELLQLENVPLEVEYVQSDFTENLRLLCSFYPSIAEVCRRLSINRSQFNKYLIGSSLPSPHTRRRICDFFGIEEHEISLPSHQLSQIVRLRRVSPDGDAEATPPYVKYIEQLQRVSSKNLQKYLGYYFEYYYSMTRPSRVLRSLIYISARGDHVYYRRMERIAPANRSDTGFDARYRGIVFYLADRLFLVDCELLAQNEISQTILFPTHKSRTTYLSGLKLGVGAGGRRPPACARVVYQVLGQNIDTRSALKLCGLLPNTSKAISPIVKQLIRNKLSSVDRHFVALEV